MAFRGKGFRFAQSLSGATKVPAEMEVVGKNSVAFIPGDLVRINQDGFCDIVDATEAIAGVCTGVVDKNGIRIDPDSGTLDTYTMASDNQTVAGKKVRFIPALQDYLFWNDATNDNAEADKFAFDDVTDQNTAVGTGADTEAQLRIIKVNPDGDGDMSNTLYQIVESQFAQTSKASAA